MKRKMNRKYPEVKGYWVYSIQIKSNGKYYIGASKCKKCSQRWHKVMYKDTTLEQYLDEWDSMIKTVLVDGLSREQAYQYEDNIIRALKMNNLCINDKRSGLIRVSDIKQYNKQWGVDNPEYHRQYYKNKPEYREHKRQYRLKNKEKYQEWYNQYYENNKEKVLEYQKQYYEKNKEKISEKRKQRYKRKKLEQQLN